MLHMAFSLHEISTARSPHFPTSHAAFHGCLLPALPPLHPPTHPLTHSPTHSLTPPPTPTPTHPLQAEGLGGLDYVLGEGGSPLSAGQKQLLALARALLNPAKVRESRQEGGGHRGDLCVCVGGGGREEEGPCTGMGAGARERVRELDTDS